MARIRSVKPEFFRSRKIRTLPYEARWLFEAMWTESDDEGRMPCTAPLLRGLFFDDDPKATERRVEGWVRLLADKKLLVLYEVDGTRYAAVAGWKEHQKINKPQSAKYPPPPPDRLFDPDDTHIKESGTESGNGSGIHSGNGSGTHSSRGKEGKGKEESLEPGSVRTALGDVSDVAPPLAVTEADEETLKAIKLLVRHGSSEAGAADLVANLGPELVFAKLEEPA